MRERILAERGWIVVLFLAVIGCVLSGCGRDGADGRNGTNGKDGSSQELIYVCHIPVDNSNGKKPHNIYVPIEFVQEYLDAGDYLGECQ